MKTMKLCIGIKTAIASQTCFEAFGQPTNKYKSITILTIRTIIHTIPCRMNPYIHVLQDLFAVDFSLTKIKFGLSVLSWFLIHFMAFLFRH